MNNEGVGLPQALLFACGSQPRFPDQALISKQLWVMNWVTMPLQKKKKFGKRKKLGNKN